MKKQVAAFVEEQGLSTSYSGKMRKMFIKGKGARRVHDLVKEAFPTRSFKISHAQ